MKQNVYGRFGFLQQEEQKQLFLQLQIPYPSNFNPS